MGEFFSGLDLEAGLPRAVWARQGGDHGENK